MKKIAVDAMGGDNAPQALVEGVNQTVQEFSDIEILLYGDEAKIKPYLTAGERVRIIHTEEKIDSDDEPTKAIRQKKEASMVLAAKAVKAGEADAMLSAGNTGALELHNSLYFCQTEDVNTFEQAEPIPGPSTDFFGKLARKHQIVIITSIFEKRAAG